MQAQYLATVGSDTPKTAEASFVITPKDVGSIAVRPGHMADLERQHDVLLLACKALQRRIRSGDGISAAHEFMLEAAIKAVEA